ncbi:hypothetical protein QVD17_41266 [Tagetes erecta]|uniref:Uncharacterized protein n=1 Tax=Tagetes erecta TaxID=13708 RepID=A0AAD8NIC1_TARER|nr:hypothetical protein QVD17_41266 [Tagetes erecta]
MAARLLQRQINLLKQRWSGEVNMLKHRSTSEINWLNRRCCSSSSSPPSDSGTMINEGLELAMFKPAQAKDTTSEISNVLDQSFSRIPEKFASKTEFQDAFVTIKKTSCDYQAAVKKALDLRDSALQLKYQELLHRKEEEAIKESQKIISMYRKYILLQRVRLTNCKTLLTREIHNSEALLKSSDAKCSTEIKNVEENIKLQISDATWYCRYLMLGTSMPAVAALIFMKLAYLLHE